MLIYFGIKVHVYIIILNISHITVKPVYDSCNQHMLHIMVLYAYIIILNISHVTFKPVNDSCTEHMFHKMVVHVYIIILGKEPLGLKKKSPLHKMEL